MRPVTLTNLLTLITLTLIPFSQHAQAQATHTVDVLGIYSDHTAQRLSDPAALFVRNIEYANRALANSGANLRYNLVHVEQRSWSGDDSLGGAQLRNFAENAAIQALREQYGADLVAGLVPSSSGLCGIGYLPSSQDGQTLRSFSRRYAYSLSGDDCGGRTMAHEMGHNTGLGHSARQNSSGTFGRWARGHGVDNDFVTIMAYGSAYGVFSSGGRLQIHSNPDISSCRQQPCGIRYTLSDGADAVRSLNLASSQIADYTPSIDTPSNNPPIAADDNLTTEEGQAAELNVLTNDSDPDGDILTLTSVIQPANGVATVQSPGGDVRYVPRTGFFGEDRFDYQVRDSAGGTAAASVSVTVTERVIVDPPTDSNLVINGDAEGGLNAWQGVWGTTLSLGTPGLDGDQSVQANNGYGTAVDLQTPFAGGRTLSFSASLSATQTNLVYVYLRVQQNGRWRYQYVTGAYVKAGAETDLAASIQISSGEISDGIVLFYFPRSTRGDVLIDSVRLEPR